jgi:hypothetical protein
MSDAAPYIHLPIDWGRSVLRTWEFQTSVFTSGDGDEKRNAAREFPRRNLTFKRRMSKARHHSERFKLASAAGGEFAFADTIVQIWGTMVNEKVLQLDSVAPEITAERQVVLTTEYDTNEYELREVHTTDISGKVYFDTAVFKAGVRVLVSPVRTVHLNDQDTLSFLTNSVADGSVGIRFEQDQIDMVRYADYAPAAEYVTRPLLLWRPNWAEELTEAWVPRELKKDIGYGRTLSARRGVDVRRVTGYSILTVGQEEIDELVAFFTYCRGQWKSFYAPTWVADFHFIDGVVPGDTSGLVENTGLLDLFDGSEMFRHIAFVGPERCHPARILSILEEGEHLRVTWDNPIPEDDDYGHQASWLLRQRFATDTLAVEYLTDQLARATLSFSSLLDRVEALQIGGQTILMSGNLITIGVQRYDPAPDLLLIAGQNVTVAGDLLG